MTWQIWLTISIFCLSLNGLFHRSLLKDDKSDAKAQTVAFLTLGGILTIIISFLNGKLQFNLPVELTYNLIILGVVGSTAYFLRYRGFQILDASEVIIFSTTSKFWNVIGGYFFLNESISLQKIIGSIVIILGIAIAVYKRGKFTLNKGVVFVLLSALLFGISDINGYHILQSVPAFTYQIYFYFLPIVAILLFQPKTIFKLGYYLNPTRATKITLLSIFDTLGMLALFYSYQAGGKASIIGPLSASKIIITTILGILILKERSYLANKLFGAVITLLGVILLL